MLGSVGSNCMTVPFNDIFWVFYCRFFIFFIRCFSSSLMHAGLIAFRFFELSCVQRFSDLSAQMAPNVKSEV